MLQSPSPIAYSMNCARPIGRRCAYSFRTIHRATLRRTISCFDPAYGSTRQPRGSYSPQPGLRNRSVAPMRHCITFSRRRLDSEMNGPTSFADQVQGVLHNMLRGGTATADAVARLFAVPERTLRRRLAKEGKALQELINETRYDLARELLQNTKLQVAEIAATLQYADPNAFSRAFRSWAKVSPRQWRAARAAGEIPGRQ
jgi:AraC-like DNA-binding protein